MAFTDFLNGLKIKLVIIDELGDFIEFSDVLIEPHKKTVKIIDFPKQNLLNSLFYVQMKLKENRPENTEQEQDETSNINNKNNNNNYNNYKATQTQVLDEEFERRVLAKGAECNGRRGHCRAPRAPDLTVCDFALWSILKRRPRPRNLDELEERILRKID